MVSAPPPSVISMEVDDDDFESFYRLRVGDQVKYLVIHPGTFDRDTLSFPVPDLPPLPCGEDWTVARVSRDKASGLVQVSTSNKALLGVQCIWHSSNVNCLDFEKIQLLTPSTCEALYRGDKPSIPKPPTTVIVKIARFEWEIPRIEQETQAYQLLQNSGLTPRFLGHVHEGGRIIGLVLEKLEGRPACIGDLEKCKAALQKLHSLGLVHGDANRYNFLITADGAKLIDFEKTAPTANSMELKTQEEELRQLETELVDNLGRGGGFIFQAES